MDAGFQYNVFLNHSAKDKQAVPVPNVARPLAERLPMAVRRRLLTVPPLSTIVGPEVTDNSAPANIR